MGLDGAKERFNGLIAEGMATVEAAKHHGEAYERLEITTDGREYLRRIS